MFLPWPKATVLVVSGPNHDPNRKHLFVLLTHGLGEDERILMVSVSTFDSALPCDTSCVIEAGEHPFVRHRSWIRYDRPKYLPAAKILRAVESGVFIPRDPVSDALYERICDGLMRSPFAAPGDRAFLAWHRNL